jgi:hypothetical protein
VLDSQISFNSGEGIDATACGTLIVDRCLIGAGGGQPGNGIGGVAIRGNFRITNSLIVGNGTSATMTGQRH